MFTAVIGVFEALLFCMLGRIVDWLAKVEPSRLWAEQRGHLLLLGAVLAGGAVPPLTGDDRSPAAWLDTTRAFHDVALETRAGHLPIPLLVATETLPPN